MKKWNLTDAKNRFSEVVNLALTKGPQRIQRGKDEVVILDAKEYDRLQGKRPDFKDYLVNGPTLEDLNLERGQGQERDIKV